MKRSREGLGWKIARNIIIVIGLALIIAPLYLVLINTFKTLEEAGRSFFALPKSLSFDNYLRLFRDNNYWKYALNSIYVTIIGIILVVTIVPAVSYAIARNFNKKYYKFLYFYLIMGLFIPGQVVMLPLIKFMSKSKMLNHEGLIILYATFAMTQGVFLFVNYIRSLPYEIEESAKIDGCNTFSIYIRIILPLVGPMLATLIVLNALWFWNDFFLPLMMLNRSRDFWTLPLFQFNFKTEYSFDYTMSFTAYLMAMIPILVVYAFGQKFIIKGLTSGALKG